jgi:hypothetical protein
MDQLMGLVRQVLPVIGGILVALGWLPETFIAAIKANMESILAAISALWVAGGAIWAAWANSKTSIVQSVAQMPESKVTPVNGGGVRIDIPNQNLANAAIQAATPQSKPNA